MTNAPERIWAEDCSGEWKDDCGAWCVDKEVAYDVQYIRSDIHDALVKAADDLADHIYAVAEWMRSNGHDDSTDHNALAAYKQAKGKANEV